MHFSLPLLRFKAVWESRRRLLRVPWTARRSNQSILKEISPEYSLEGLMLKQKFQYFGHLMRRTDLFEKRYMGVWRWESVMMARMMSRFPKTVTRYKERKSPKRTD